MSRPTATLITPQQAQALMQRHGGAQVAFGGQQTGERKTRKSFAKKVGALNPWKKKGVGSKSGSETSVKPPESSLGDLFNGINWVFLPTLQQSPSPQRANLPAVLPYEYDVPRRRDEHGYDIPRRLASPRFQPVPGGKPVRDHADFYAGSVDEDPIYSPRRNNSSNSPMVNDLTQSYKTTHGYDIPRGIHSPRFRDGPAPVPRSRTLQHPEPTATVPRKQMSPPGEYAPPIPRKRSPPGEYAPPVPRKCSPSPRKQADYHTYFPTLNQSSKQIDENINNGYDIPRPRALPRRAQSPGVAMSSTVTPRSQTRRVSWSNTVTAQTPEDDHIYLPILDHSYEIPRPRAPPPRQQSPRAPRQRMIPPSEYAPSVPRTRMPTPQKQADESDDWKDHTYESIPDPIFTFIDDLNNDYEVSRQRMSTPQKKSPTATRPRMSTPRKKSPTATRPRMSTPRKTDESLTDTSISPLVDYLNHTYESLEPFRIYNLSPGSRSNSRRAPNSRGGSPVRNSGGGSPIRSPLTSTPKRWCSCSPSRDYSELMTRF